MKRKVNPRACTFSLSWEDVATEGHLELTVILSRVLRSMFFIEEGQLWHEKILFQDIICCMDWQCRISPCIVPATALPLPEP